MSKKTTLDQIAPLELLLEDIEDPEDIELVSRLADLRDKKGYTQRQLADLVGVTDTTVANWERGRNGLDWFERVYKLCVALDCDPRDLFERRLKPGARQKKNRFSQEKLYAAFRALALEIRNENESPASQHPSRRSKNREMLDEIVKELKQYAALDEQDLDPEVGEKLGIDNPEGSNEIGKADTKAVIR